MYSTVMFNVLSMGALISLLVKEEAVRHIKDSLLASSRTQWEKHTLQVQIQNEKLSASFGTR
jgi:predicted amino acid-binding ACT domain protein